MTDLVTQIEEYIAKRNLQQSELASIWGIRPETLNRWLSRKHKISQAYQRFISDKLKNNS